MIAYKGFDRGLVCRGYRFVMGLNVTDQANCAANGFHCAEDPLDCLTYYSDMKHSEYCLVNAGGDVDEDEHDSKIACTELTIIKKLDLAELVLHALAYIADHPGRKWNRHVQLNRGRAENGFVIVRGIDPLASGKKGDVLGFAKESPDGGKIVQIAMIRVDGEKIVPDRWYDTDLTERKAV